MSQPDLGEEGGRLYAGPSVTQWGEEGGTGSQRPCQVR